MTVDVGAGALSGPADRPVPRVLSIAGTDPTGGAGSPADLKSIAANGGYGMAVVTAVVAQNTIGVRLVHAVPADVLDAQLRAVSDDVAIDAVKIGMLGSVEAIAVVQRWLDDVLPPVVVVDPVMVATSGDPLLAADALVGLRGLLGRADLVTPNVPELAALLDAEPAETWDDVLAQARRLAASCGAAVLAKGGHLRGERVRDALVPVSSGAVIEVSGPRIATTATHGTGCSLSSAMATRLATGADGAAALRASRSWLIESISAGERLGVGAGHGPVSHLAGLWARGGLDTAPTPDDVGAEWRRAAAGLRREVLELPFVRGLADGTLPERAFRDYLAQDAVYLRAYSRVLATASRLASDAAEQSFWARGASQALEVELRLHAERLGVAATAEVQPATTTTTYLRFLESTADHADYPRLVAALLPCYWLYRELGDHLLPGVDDAHPFAEWVRTYGAPEFATAADTAFDVATRLAAEADSRTRGELRSTFLEALALERDFFPALGAERPGVIGPGARSESSSSGSPSVSSESQP